MNTKQLKQRWKDDRELANATTAWLGDTSLPIPAGISQVDGLIDLRGLPTFPAGPVRKITSTRWDHLDLSHSDLSGLQLRDVEITDCRLDQANLKRAHLINVECSRTTLVSADLQSAGFGALTPETQTIWREVDFTYAKISRHLWVGATIDRCTFRGTKMKRSEFHRCLITDTVFATDLTEVTFNGTTQGMMKSPPFPDYDRVPMRRLDLTDAKLFFTAFRKCAMEDTTWPDNPDIQIIDLPSPRLDAALSWLDSQGNREDAAAAKAIRRATGEASIALPQGTPFILINLAEDDTPPTESQLRKALEETT